jgi:hypothetical protein
VSVKNCFLAGNLKRKKIHTLPNGSSNYSNFIYCWLERKIKFLNTSPTTSIVFTMPVLHIGHLETVRSCTKYEDAHQKHDSQSEKCICFEIFFFSLTFSSVSMMLIILIRTMVYELDEYKAFYKIDKQLDNSFIYDLSIVRYRHMYCMQN